ncbi:cupin domain-containing protein [Dongia sp.]|uniref:cupin domain-containing protein n=1 Tax=Dongia sp. TaxID=1977262 RepID=UPI0035B40C58
MRKFWPVMTLLLATAPALAEDAKPPVVVTPILTTDRTVSGQPIQWPRQNAELVTATYEIAPGTSLPVHKHPFPRYAYVLAGTLEVTNTETGKAIIFHPGDVIVEAVNQWHKGANIGPDPVKLFVMDMIEKGEGNVVKKYVVGHMNLE